MLRTNAIANSNFNLLGGKFQFLLLRWNEEDSLSFISGLCLKYLRKRMTITSLQWKKQSLWNGMTYVCGIITLTSRSTIYGRDLKPSWLKTRVCINLAFVPMWNCSCNAFIYLDRWWCSGQTYFGSQQHFSDLSIWKDSEDTEPVFAEV